MANIESNKTKQVRHWQDKLVLMGIIVFVLALAGSYLAIAYLYYPIESPKDQPLVGSYMAFDLSSSNAVDAEAQVLDFMAEGNGSYVYLIEDDGVCRLQCYTMHKSLQRRRLADERIVDAQMTGDVPLHHGIIRLEKGQIAGGHSYHNGGPDTSWGISLLAAAGVTVLVMVPLCLLANYIKRREERLSA